MSREYSLLLVNPKRRFRYNWDLQEMTRVMGRRAAAHPLALPLIAALTPSRYHVEIADEEFGRLRPRRAPDIVGITSMVSNVERAFELADRFRADGVKVVLGGPEVSANVEEALAHADAVVVGEAEEVWQGLLEDFEAGRLGEVYEASERAPFETSPPPRWDLVDTSKIMACGVQVSRGCPFHCEFCLVHGMFGGEQRYREIDDLIREIESLPLKRVAFADDNLTANKRFARELMDRLEPLGIDWSCQASLDTACDRHLVERMAAAGCSSILIGFETLKEEGLKQAGKSHNQIARYEEAIRNVQQAGIHVIGSFVVGFEADGPETFDEVLDFTRRNNLCYVMLNALAAYRGTALYERLAREGRIAPWNRSNMNGIDPTIHYKKLTRVEMFNGCLETLEKIYDYESLAEKGPALLGNGAFTRAVEDGVGFAQKLRSTLYLVFTHILSPNRHKRRLTRRLLRLVREGTTHVGVVIPFLLFLASINGYLTFTRRRAREVLRQIEQGDRLRGQDGQEEPSARTGA